MEFYDRRSGRSVSVGGFHPTGDVPPGTPDEDWEAVHDQHYEMFSKSQHGFGSIGPETDLSRIAEGTANPSDRAQWDYKPGTTGGAGESGRYDAYLASGRRGGRSSWGEAPDSKPGRLSEPDVSIDRKFVPNMHWFGQVASGGKSAPGPALN